MVWETRKVREATSHSSTFSMPAHLGPNLNTLSLMWTCLSQRERVEHLNPMQMPRRIWTHPVTPSTHRDWHIRTSSSPYNQPPWCWHQTNMGPITNDDPPMATLTHQRWWKKNGCAQVYLANMVNLARLHGSVNCHSHCPCEVYSFSDTYPHSIILMLPPISKLSFNCLLI